MKTLKYISQVHDRDEEFGIIFNIPKLESELIDKAKEMTPLETGGILIGYYDKECKYAIVTDIHHIPGNEERSYIRDADIMMKILERVSKYSRGEEYYIGEWHTHPGDNPDPTDIDDKTMFDISESDSPNPILVTIGGEFELESLRVNVYSNNKKIEMRKEFLS